MVNILNSNSYCKQWKYLFLIVILIILTTNCFEYKNWNKTYTGWLQHIIFFIFFISYCLGLIKTKKCNFKNEITILMIIPFCSMINSMNYFNQSFYGSFVALSGSFAWIIYFLLHKYNVSEEIILRTFLFIALLIVGLQVVQQFTYPHVAFGIAAKDDNTWGVELAEQRNGFWRFRMHNNAYFTTPILFALWIRFKRTFNWSLMPLIVLLLISVYLTLTRQIIAACLIVIFCSFLIGKKVKITTIILIILLLVGLYYSYDFLFSSFTEQTKEENTENNIRILAATYYWNESIRTPWTFLFGYGLPATKGTYLDYILQIRNLYKFYTTDVGFVGQIYERGILYVIACYILMYRLFVQLKNKIPEYIRLFVLFTGIMSPMIFPYIETTQFIIWGMLLYICDLHINNSPLVLRSQNTEK